MPGATQGFAEQAVSFVVIDKALLVRVPVEFLFEFHGYVRQVANAG